MTRYAHIKGPNEHSTYGFGIIQRRTPGPADRYEAAITELDVRAAIPIGLPLEVQIAIRETKVYETRALQSFGYLTLTPDDARCLALEMCPELRVVLESCVGNLDPNRRGSKETEMRILDILRDARCQDTIRKSRG